MGVETTATTTWTCDRCRKQVVQKDQPSTAADPWGKLFIDQPSGFDFSGAPWAPRMREPALMCGTCLDEIVAFINQRPT